MGNRWLVVALWLMGCGGVAVSGDGGDPDGGGADASADALTLPDGFTCTPGATVACDLGDLLTCDEAGTGIERTDCRAQCLSNAGGEIEPGFHCAVLAPTYLSSSCDERSLGAGFVAGPGTSRLDTGAAATCTGGLVPQREGPPICVVRAPTFQLLAGATIVVVGENTLAVVVDDELVIDGVLDVSAERAVSGPGGQARASGGQATASVGGGGAGFRTAGGAGGNGGEPGAALTPSRDVMVAGAHASARSPLGGAGGGGGGGGVILASCRGGVTIGASGVIDAGGGGGDAGFVAASGLAYAGGGGGSGGFVVLQGLAVHVAGGVYANGGSGGGGVQPGALAEPGADGARIVGPAPGGSGAGSGGDGGSGAGGTSGPVSGANATGGGSPGGGGGAAGRIQIYVPGPAVTPDVPSTAISPPLEPTGAATYF